MLRFPEPLPGGQADLILSQADLLDRLGAIVFALRTTINVVDGVA
jgi:hypothetical protein